MSAPIADRIAELVAEHAHPGELLTVFDEAWMVCGCGLRIELPVVNDAVNVKQANDRWRAHLATVLAPLLEEAVREAVDAALAPVEALAGDWERGYNSPTATSWARVHTKRLRTALRVGREASR